MNWSLVADVIIFGAIAIIVVINTVYGSGILIRWIWKKVKKWKHNIK